MASVTVITPPRDKDPRRVALVHAIETARTAQCAEQAHRIAIQRAAGMLADAEATLERARETATTAKEEAASRLADAAAGISDAPDKTLRDALAAETVTRDELGAARAVLANLKAKLSEVEDEARHADNGIAAAVNSVLAPEAARLLDEAEALKSKLLATWSTLFFILDSVDGDQRRDDGPKVIANLRASNERRAALLEIRPAIERELANGIVFKHAEAARHPVLDPWRRALEALRHDADAQLPHER